MKPVVSIVIPVYNRVKFLGATLDSILAQTLQEWELFVVDDGSTEDVGGFLNADKDSRIYFMRQHNQGNAAARNNAIRRASGQFCICLDSDDVWLPGMLRAGVDYLTKNQDADVVYSQFQEIDAQGKALPRPVSPEPLTGDLLRPLLLGFPILPSSALVRRQCFAKWGYYTPGLDDWELWLRWAARGCRFGVLAVPYLGYRIHQENYSQDWNGRRKIHFDILDAFYQQPNLPDFVYSLQDEAYAWQYAQFAALAWRLKRPEDAMSDFATAVNLNPALLQNEAFLMQLACVDQDRYMLGTASNLDMDHAASNLLTALDEYYSNLNGAVTKAQKRQTYGWAYYVLAKLAYGIAQDQKAARQLFIDSMKYWFTMVRVPGWLAWGVRCMIGSGTLTKVKSFKA